MHLLEIGWNWVFGPSEFALHLLPANRADRDLLDLLLPRLRLPQRHGLELQPPAQPASLLHRRSRFDRPSTIGTFGSLARDEGAAFRTNPLALSGRHHCGSIHTTAPERKVFPLRTVRSTDSVLAFPELSLPLMNRVRTLCDLDWQKVRMITIDGLCVRILDEEAEFTFQFANNEELQSALKHWAGITNPQRSAMAVSVSMNSCGPTPFEPHSRP